MLRVVPLAFLFAVAACSRPEPIAFDPNNDAHCVLAFLETEEAAREGGGKELAKGMKFRANWARKAARAKGEILSDGQKASLNEYLRKGAREGSQSTIACRHRQNADPSFPRQAVPYA